MSSTDRLVPAIYHCYGGTHSSVAGAALRCGLLSPSSSSATCFDLPWFDRVPLAAVGFPLRIGTDGDGREVYAVGRQSLGGWLERFLPTALSGMGLPTPALIDAGATGGYALKLGGLLSRRLGLGLPGRRLLSRGISQAWPGLIALAQRQLDRTPMPSLPAPAVLIMLSSGPEGLTMMSGSGVRVAVARLGTRAPLAKRLIRELVGVLAGQWVTVIDG